MAVPTPEWLGEVRLRQVIGSHMALDGSGLVRHGRAGES